VLPGVTVTAANTSTGDTFVRVGLWILLERGFDPTIGTLEP